MRRATKEEKLTQIHNATIQLMQTININNISIYDVANKASVATSTVYHHYPNIESLFYRVMEEVFSEFDSVLACAVEPDRVEIWPDINRMIEDGYAKYYQDNITAQKLLLSQHTFTSIRHADAENDLRLAEKVESIYRQYFELPKLPEKINIFAIALQVANKVYSMSYRETGEITREYAEEAIRLTESYLSIYMPKYMLANKGGCVF